MPTIASSSSSSRLPNLPAGFRFHPTDEELIVHYLMNQASSLPCPVPIIAEVNIYQCNPWDLPAKALFGDKEWYFFSPRDRKYPNGARPNRAAGSGYWKATGTDKAIVSTPTSDNIGVKKALVFYGGKPPRGTKTDWIMHEYRLLTTGASNRATKRCRGSSSMRLDDWVLCRIHKKSNNFRFGDPEQEEGSSTVEEESLNNNINSAASPRSDANDDDRDDDHDQFQFQAPATAAATTTTTTTTMSKSYSITDLLNTIDYTALSQLLDEPPLIYPTAATAQSHHQAAPHSFNSNAVMNSNSHSINNLLPQVDYVLNAPPNSCNGGLMKRKRVMTVDGGDAESPSSFDDGSSRKLLKKLPSPSDSARSSGHFAGSASGGGGGYCNQQQLVDTSGGFQYSSLLSYPFLEMQSMQMQ